MKGILLAKLANFIRNPATFLLFTGMSIVFTVIIGSSGGNDRITVPVAGNQTIIEGAIEEALEENEVYHFRWMEQDEMEEMIRRGNAEAGILLDNEGYEMK